MILILNRDYVGFKMKNATSVNLKNFFVHLDGTVVLRYVIFLFWRQHTSAHCSKILQIHFAEKTPWIKLKLGLAHSQQYFHVYCMKPLGKIPQSGARIRDCSAALWNYLEILLFVYIYIYLYIYIYVSVWFNRLWSRFYVRIWQISFLVYLFCLLNYIFRETKLNLIKL